MRFALFTELLRTSDVVTLHVPLDDSTRNMMATAELAMMKPTAILSTPAAAGRRRGRALPRRSRRNASPAPAST